MNFVAIDYNTAKNIVSDRNLQSADFKAGKILSEALKNYQRENEYNFSNLVKITDHSSGLYLVSKESSHQNKSILVFDTTTFKGFEKNENDIITILQKSCRLAIKIWDNIGHSPCEKIINGSTIALLPLSFTTGKSYKVILSKAADQDRQEKRNNKSLLIYHDGYDNAPENIKLSNFRKAKEGFLSLDINKLFSHNENEDEKHQNYLTISNIESADTIMAPYMGLNYWLEHLTEKQKNFVTSESLGPDILKGAAGTGKTLSLILRSVVQLKKAKEKNENLKAIFITHSIATKSNIENLIASNGGEEFIDSNENQSIKITTLQEWCLDNLGNRLSATEYLDSDAMESKNQQLLYINEAFEEFMIHDYIGATSFISKELKNFLSNNDYWTTSIILQDEMSTYIKGRSGGNVNAYIELPRSSLSIPLVKEDDFRTVFSIYERYQKKLIAINSFDSDDIVLTALQETSTPIWKRRRAISGYDVMYIDETHLFNINELSLFHNLLKPNINNIIFTIDRSQSGTDSAINKNDIIESLKSNLSKEYGFNAVFRSSDEIINLASCVLASGALLFKNLENPLIGAMSGVTSRSAENSPIPYIIRKQNTNEMIQSSFNLVDYISDKNQIKKSEILIVPCTEKIFEKIKDYAQTNKKNHSLIEKRGDISTVNFANENNNYLIGGMEYIGGLEFNAVIIIGPDSDKFPPTSESINDSSHFVKYSSFNKLYVAITRAKYEVAFICEKTQKISELLEQSLEQGFVVYDDQLAEKI